MSKVAVVFWSGTGNTGIMATKVAEGVTEAGGEATILPADQFNAEMMDSYDAIAFGCPSMGAEQLAKRLLCLVLTDGVMVNGCVHGKKHVSVMEPLWRVIS